jgi:hypothetical protein
MNKILTFFGGFRRHCHLSKVAAFDQLYSAHFTIEKCQNLTGSPATQGGAQVWGVVAKYAYPNLGPHTRRVEEQSAN